jgi:nicotinamidase/pyrazinamidase
MKKSLSDFSADPSIALIVVDQQYDFEPGGALAVLGGQEIAHPIAELMQAFQTVVVTQDTHPPGHISFASSYQGKKPFDLLAMDEVLSRSVKTEITLEMLKGYLEKTPNREQVLWPDHCVMGTKGWQINPMLPLERATLILRKGTKRHCDSYSALYENDGSPTGLLEFLKERSITTVIPVGLAGDYCVYWTAKDARNNGLKVIFDKEYTRYVNFPADSRETALEDMNELGVEFV